MPGAQPAAIRLLKGRGAGTDSGGRKVKQPPPFKRIPPTPPEYLGVYAQIVWEETVGELSRLDLLKPIDAHALGAYCEAVAVFADACRDVRENGINLTRTVTSREGDEWEVVYANPSVLTRIKASNDLRNWAREFGLTPSSEQNVGKGEYDDDDSASSF